MTTRNWIGGLPENMRKLPVDHRGFPIPYFVAWQDGKPLFPVMDPRKQVLAIRQDRCWVCGQKTYANKCFVIGPMCCINRINSEPPSHYECARFSALNCPFLSKPLAKRTTSEDGTFGTTPISAPAGIMLARNPGVTCIWVTKRFKIFTDRGLPLWELGPATRTEFYAQGRQATRAEIDASVSTGLPTLRGLAERDGPEAVEMMERRLKAFTGMLDAVPMP